MTGTYCTQVAQTCSGRTETMPIMSKEVGREGFVWIQLAQDDHQICDLFNAVRYLLVSWPDKRVSMWARTLIREFGVGDGLKREGRDVSKRVDRDRGALLKLAGNTEETKTAHITQHLFIQIRPEIHCVRTDCIDFVGNNGEVCSRLLLKNTDSLSAIETLS
jgi:hypothetical protein